MPVIIIALLSIIAGTVIWFIEDETFVGYAIGLPLGIALGATLLIAIVRKMGRKAQKSSFASSLFRKITRYKATVYVIQTQDATARATIYDEGHDYADLLDILKNQMKFPSNTAKGAAKYAMNTTKGLPLQEKIRTALQYVGGSEKNVAPNA